MLQTTTTTNVEAHAAQKALNYKQGAQKAAESRRRNAAARAAKAEQVAKTAAVKKSARAARVAAEKIREVEQKIETSTNKRGRPSFPSANTIAELRLAHLERDDEFGTAKKMRAEARRVSSEHGHELHPFSFKGDKRWVTYCSKCVKVAIVDGDGHWKGINYFGKKECGPCVENKSSLRVLGRDYDDN